MDLILNTLIRSFINSRKWNAEGADEVIKKYEAENGRVSYSVAMKFFQGSFLESENLKKHGHPEELASEHWRATGAMESPFPTDSHCHRLFQNKADDIQLEFDSHS